MPLIGFAFTDRALDYLETLPHKIRRQIVKKAKALHTNPHPQGAKKLQGVETDEGEFIWRERSGDYRILYVVRSDPASVLILDIDHRKDVYRMLKTNSEPANERQIGEAEFDDIMRGGLGEAAQPPIEEPRLAAHPRKRTRR